MATIIEVNQFLRRFKAQVTKQGGIELVHRDVNIKGIANLGLTLSDVDDYILELKYLNYSLGPESDKDGSGGEIWIFCTQINSRNVYIKLKLDTKAKCISFHPAEHSMHQPYNLGGTS